MIKFKDFVTSYTSELWGQDGTNETPEPLEVYFGEDGMFLFAVDWHKNNMEDLKRFVSKKVFESYVEKIGLRQDSGRIFVRLTDKMED